MMITELTAEQKARLPEFIKKWSRIGLCTDPANRPEAEEGVRLSYRIAGLAPPQKIVWCESPLSMALAQHLVRVYGTPSGVSVISELAMMLASVREPLYDLVSLPVTSLAWSLLQVSALTFPIMQHILISVDRTFLFSSWNSIGDSVRDSALDSVRVSLVPGVWGSAGNLVDLELKGAAPFHDTLGGHHNLLDWLAFYDYFRVVCGMTKQTEKMLGLKQVVENAGWWLPHRDICWISERPDRLKLDGRGRFHCEDGPALSYPDGFSIYAIHGVLLNEQIIMRPRSQDVDKIRKESNAEVKRIRIERFGWGEYLKAVGAVVIDTRDNDVEATKEALMKTPDGQFVLVCACPSTSRVYCLEVPSVIRSCEAAQDWLSGGLSHRVINGA